MWCSCYVLTDALSGGDALRRRSADIPRQELVDPVDRVLADARENVAQIGGSIIAYGQPHEPALRRVAHDVVGAVMQYFAATHNVCAINFS